MKKILSTVKGRVITGVVGVLFVACVVGAVIAILPKDYRNIKITNLSGEVIVSNNAYDTQYAYTGMNLESGNYVSVEKQSNMVLLLDADKYMFADEGTKFKVEASGDSEKSNTRTKIVLEEGSILCRLDSALSDEESFEVETPNSTMAVRGTIFRMSIYQDEAGENYTQLDVLEGSVKVDLYMEDGEKTGKEGIVEAGQAATVHSNPEISEFVIGESDISYEDFSDVMAEFVVASVEEGQEICIGTSLFKHYTGLENHPEDETITREATCALEGKKEFYCSICDVVVREEVIEKLEHTPGEVEETTEGTCEEKAKELTTCLVCGEKFVLNELEFGEHKYSDWKLSKEVTCTVKGEESSICEYCGDVKTRTIEPTGHEFGEWVETSIASCVTNGENTRICNMCGKIETESISGEHNYGSWVVKKAATCIATGEQTKTCSECGKAETQTIAALGHSFDAWQVQMEATCESNGEMTRICNECGSIEFQEIAGGSGHSYPEHTSSVGHSWVPKTTDPTGRELDYIVVELQCSTCKDYGSTQQYEYLEVQAEETRYDDTTGVLIYYKCACGYEGP